MGLSFSFAIPANTRTPGSYIGFANDRAGQGLAPWPTRILVLGQALATAVVPNLTPTLIGSAAQGTQAFGQGSMLDQMIQALIANNSVTETWAMSVADPVGGVKATSTITVTAAPTAAGSLPLYIAGQSVAVAVTAGQTVASVATAIAAAINALPNLPVTAAAVAGVVTLTCKWAGLSGNDIDVRTAYQSSDVMPAGLALTLAAGTAGAGAPNIAAAIATMGDTQYHFIVLPWTDGATLAAMATELANRWGPMEEIEGFAFASAKGSQGSLATLGTSQNSQFISISECAGPDATWVRAAAEVGVIALYGSADPARPFQTLALAGCLPGNPTERFTRTERNVLLNDGISTHTVAGGQVLLERPITTYQLNAQGLPDNSYLDVTTMLTLAYLRFTLRAMIATKYPRHKLANDGLTVAPGQAVVTPKILTAEIVALAGQWEDAALIEDISTFQSLINVQRNAGDPTRIDAYIPPDIVSGLLIFAGEIDFAF
jgi:phage tail sheath gpL-like